MITMFQRGDISVFNDIENCIIIGNSSNVLSKKYGKFIDTFDCVVRLNAAPTDGFETDVGTKTTFRVVNEVLQNGRSLDGTENSRNWIGKLRNENLIFKWYSESSEEHGKRLAKKHNNLYLVSDPFKKYLKEFKDHFNMNLLSTGIFSILVFIHIFEEITIFGFDFYTSRKISGHYWEDFDGGNLDHHNFQTEKRFVKFLESKNKVNIY